MSEEVRAVLNEIGYTSLSNDGEYWRAKPLYRDSGNPTSLRIRKNDGSFIDFSENVSGNLERLISITLGISIDKAKDYSKFIEEREPEKETISDFEGYIKMDEMTLLPSYYFYIQRGIRKEILEELGAKLCMSGKMVRRVIFPIEDDKGRVIGIDGRSVIEDHPIKWKKLGKKNNWIYPRSAIPYIKKHKKVILVEGISDVVALRNAGIYYAVPIFGTTVLPKLLAAILSWNPNEIIIATNNELENNSIGNKAAVKIREKLLKFFSEEVIKIKLPPLKDFGVMTPETIKQWESEN